RFGIAQIVDHDGRALARETAGDFRADASAGAGHQYDFSGEFLAGVHIRTPAKGGYRRRSRRRWIVGSAPDLDRRLRPFAKAADRMCPTPAWRHPRRMTPWRPRCAAGSPPD